MHKSAFRASTGNTSLAPKVPRKQPFLKSTSFHYKEGTEICLGKLSEKSLNKCDNTIAISARGSPSRVNFSPNSTNLPPFLPERDIVVSEGINRFNKKPQQVRKNDTF